MGTKMEQTLRKLGFVHVLGVTEHIGGNPRPVGKGQCGSCFDTNNGLTVVYDVGHEPWLREGSVITEEELSELGLNPRTSRGAYVPCSNDGGYFALNELPKLVAEQEVA